MNLNITTEGFKTSREQYKRIKGYSHKELDGFLAEFYCVGYKDGANRCEAELLKMQKDAEAEETQIDFDEVLKTIGTVKGIGDKLLSDIKTVCEERFCNA